MGFIGHSFGGKMAMWAPAWDERFRASVSNCGCITYREALSRDAGFQADFVLPGFATRYDMEHVLALSIQCEVLLIAAEQDVWSRGAAGIEQRLSMMGVEHVRVHRVPGDHEFRHPERELAYTFLAGKLKQ